ncbi:galactose-specific lectin nattectin-like protein [Labeo rohita]|uniref:Galactose-specific lectin nattectin-like protein n=1 Tax=Labeo rohita TaxID=84645 RepID=A0A498N7U6_LABRO|nr:galactose-specific lectin nattectin-like protein [Labeo rohita]
MAVLRSLLLLFTVFSMGNAEVEKCPYGWRSFGVQCYKFFPGKVNWITAEDGEWMWSDGTPYDYTNWCSVEPNVGGSENCMEINWTINHCWNDRACFESLGYACATAIFIMAVLRSLLLLFIAFSMGNAGVDKCPYGWKNFGVRCYKFFQETVNWITAEEKQWLWSDGTAYDYTNWCHGEPNGGGSENCVEINWTSNYCWNDKSCSSSLSYVCATDL